MKLKVLFASIALAAGLASAGAQAAPAVSGGVEQMTSAAPAIEQVQYRGRGWAGRGYGRGYRGWGPWVGIGAGVAAGVLIYDELYRPRRGSYYDTYAYDGPYYYPADYHGDPRDICARHFKSFEWRTGYYTTYSGQHRLCPYLQ